MVWCYEKCRDTEFKTLKGAHFERLGDENDTANYCNKDETHDGVFRAAWGWPEPKYIEEIDELYDWEIEILDMLDKEPHKRHLYWYWEPNGCAGKTTFQKYVHSRRDDCIVLSGKAHDMKHAIAQYKENKNGKVPRVVLINIPKSSSEFISYTGLEEIKDMFFFSGKYEGDNINGARPHVFIFANEPPNYDKMTNGRFIVKELNKKHDEIEIIGWDL